MKYLALFFWILFIHCASGAPKVSDITAHGIEKLMAVPHRPRAVVFREFSARVEPKVIDGNRTIIIEFDEVDPEIRARG